MEHPDAKKHQTVSFIKSAVRIAGYFLLCIAPIPIVRTAGLILVFSEIIGIIEELV